jgi:hypothetical protein
MSGSLRLYDVTTQKTMLFLVTAMRKSNPTCYQQKFREPYFIIWFKYQTTKELVAM